MNDLLSKSVDVIRLSATRKLTLAVGCIATIMFALVGCDTRLKPEAKLETKPAGQRLSPVQMFDLRTKCQAIVDKLTEEYKIGIVGNALVADVKSHYNPVTNHCYAEVLVTKNLTFKYSKTPMNYRTDSLYDAQTVDLLLHADQEGDQQFAYNFITHDYSAVYDKVSDQIHLLMTQEDE